MSADKKILVVTDNGILYSRIKYLINNDFPELVSLFEFKRSKLSSMQKLYTDGIDNLEEVDVKKEYNDITGKYKCVISLHCKQIFPKELVNNLPCINIHPGYNPYNRGWYPQVFSILNKKPLGATIHIMDEKVDHGAIIAQKEVPVPSWYTSKEAYESVLEAEIELFRENIQDIVSGNFVQKSPETEGNFNSIDDFRKLCKLNPEEKVTMAEAIDRLRALSHGKYKNAYFIDREGNKVFIHIEMTKEEKK